MDYFFMIFFYAYALGGFYYLFNGTHSALRILAGGIAVISTTVATLILDSVLF